MAFGRGVNEGVGRKACADGGVSLYCLCDMVDRAASMVRSCIICSYSTLETTNPSPFPWPQLQTSTLK